MEKIISLSESGPYGNDMAPVIWEALKENEDLENAIISLPKGIHHIYEDHCHEEFLFISNHDYGLKRIAFNLYGRKNLTIEGNNSELIFHGRITPFAIRNCRNITIRNLTIDYERPFFSQGQVLEAGENAVILRIDPKEYPYRIQEETIYFYSKGEWESDYIKWFVEFDPKRRSPAYGKGGSDLRTQKVRVEQLEPDVVRFKARFSQRHTPGNIINITHEHRYNPGIFIDGSQDIQLENIRIHHAGAMGVIGQNSRNIDLRRVEIVLREGTERMVSVNNDATHFVHCEGVVKLEDCTFENQLDDATNVHGMYQRITNVLNPNLLELETMHFQQYGFCSYRNGDVVAIVDTDTQQPKGYAEVTGVKPVNKRFTRLEVLPLGNAEIKSGDMVENFNRMPELIVRNCRIGSNIARGILLASSKKILLEGCTFYTSGTSVLIPSDIDFWYESGAVKDVTIRRNTFINCCYALWGKAVIAAGPKIMKPDKPPRPNSGVKILDNTFEAFEKAIISVDGINGFEFSGNTLRKSDAFLPIRNQESCLDIKRCSHVKIENNIVEGFTQDEFYRCEEVIT